MGASDVSELEDDVVNVANVANRRISYPIAGIKSPPIDEEVACQSHYTSSPIQPISFMEANFSHDEMVGFLKGNVLKYVSRYQGKGRVVDLKKARVYLDWLIEKEEGRKLTIMGVMSREGEQ
jgi:hypothetical protein